MLACGSRNNCGGGMSQFHRDNHYVPKFYLNQWATKGRVATCNLLVPDVRTPIWGMRSLKGIAFRQNLYTNVIDGIETDALERWLDREFEAPAERALQLAVRDQRLDFSDWRLLVRFAMSQDVRTPSRLREFLQRYGSLMPSLLDEVLTNAVAKLEAGVLPPSTRESGTGHGLPLKVEISREEDGSGKVHVETVVGRSMWQWGVEHLLTSTINKISVKGWTILKPANGFSWPTSDNPLIRLNYVNDVNYNFSGGWEVQKGDILLPLSPNHLLFRSGGVRPLKRGTRLDQITTSRIQRMIVEHADRFVFAREPFAVEAIRSRVVDFEAVREERDFWRRWNNDQIAVEQGFRK